MKYIVSKLAVCLLLFSPLASFGQCVPDVSYTIPGIYPDSLPIAYEDTPYAAVIDFRTPPPDTNVGGFPATIDSIEIISYTGFPAGFTWACNRASCMYYPNENGCLQITGTPAVGDYGNWPLTGILKIYFRVVSTPGTITDTNSNVILQVCTPDSCEGLPNTGIYEINDLQDLAIYPNPAGESVRIELTSRASGTTAWQVVDMMGRVVRNETIQLVRGRNVLERDVTDLVPGVYLQRFVGERSSAGSVFVKQ